MEWNENIILSIPVVEWEIKFEDFRSDEEKFQSYFLNLDKSV